MKVGINWRFWPNDVGNTHPQSSRSSSNPLGASWDDSILWLLSKMEWPSRWTRRWWNLCDWCSLVPAYTQKPQSNERICPPLKHGRRKGHLSLIFVSLNARPMHMFPKMNAGGKLNSKARKCILVYRVWRGEERIQALWSRQEEDLCQPRCIFQWERRRHWAGCHTIRRRPLCETGTAGRECIGCWLSSYSPPPRTHCESYFINNNTLQPRSTESQIFI